MRNRNLKFKGQMPDEVILTFYRKHWVFWLPEIIPFILFIVLYLVIILNLGSLNLPSLENPIFQFLYLGVVVLSVIFIHRFFLRMINFFLTTVIITNYRIIEWNLSLFVKNSKESIYMRKIQDVHKVQDGILHNLLRFGKLHIILGNADRTTLYHVPHPDYHFRLINRVKSGQYFKEQKTKEQLKHSEKKHRSIKADEKPYDCSTVAFDESTPALNWENQADISTATEGNKNGSTEASADRSTLDAHS